MGKVLQEVKEECIDKIYDDAVGKLNGIRNDLNFINKPERIADFTRYIRALVGLRDAAQNVTILFKVADIKNRLEKRYEEEINAYMEREVEINSRYDAMINNTVDGVKSEVDAINAKVIEEHNQHNEIYIQLENKRKKLESYKDDIIDMCSTYGITTSDVAIDNSSFTVEELGDIYDQYIDYMSKATSRRNIIGAFREKVDNQLLQGVILLILFISAFTPVLDIAAVAFFVLVTLNQFSAKKKMKSYTVLLGLVFNIRPLEMGFKEEVDSEKLIPETIDLEEDNRVSALAEEWENELKQLDKDNPKERLDQERIELVNLNADLVDEVKILLSDFETEKEQLVKDIELLITSANEEFEKRKSEVKMLGDGISSSGVLDTVFKLGLRDGVVEEEYDIGLTNIVIKPSSIPDDTRMKKFMQVLLANVICNVKATNLSITVYDPNKFGQDLVSFYDEKLERLIEFKNEGFEDIIGKLKAFAAKNMKDMRGSDINTFNSEAEKIGRTTKEYRLLFILSQPKTIEENEALTAFMRYSANLGVLVWLVSDKEIPDTKTFRAPFEGVANPYPIDLNTFGPKVANTLVEAVEAGESDSLPWKKFIDVAVPDSKIWNGVTDQFVDLLPGFYEGDPTQYKGYTVGNEGNVHIIGVGTTGAGKSVFLNHLIATLTKEYSPRDLELWMVDYKGVEFSFYLPNEKCPYMLPHIRACLCTSDGDYAGSLYTALRKEAETRYKNLMAAGYKNIKEYNKFLRNSGRESEVIPRILFINDEFQVIFEKAEQKIREQIEKDITWISKVARACGVHLFFTSQSMKGTIKDDILQQFTLRFALRCSEDVSQAILGTHHASNIKQKFGYLYVRSVEDVSLDAQKRYRTPFLSDDVLRDHIKNIAILAKDRGYEQKDVITYLESTMHYVKEIDEFYERGRSTIPQSGLMLLGSRMTYSDNKAPDNVVLDADNNTHIFSVFTSVRDVVNFYRTIRRNIANSPKAATVLVNSQIADLHYMCELDKEVPLEQQALSTEKNSVADLFMIFQTIYEMRVSNNVKDEPAYFILLGWDKADGFGLDRDQLLANEFAKLLQLCGEYNMHFIFICTNTGAIANGVIDACKFKICGKCEEDASYKILGTKQGCKVDDNMKDGYMYINRGNGVTRAKIYQSDIERKVKVQELVI